MTAAVQTPAEVVVTERGVHVDMDEATYHGDPVPGGSLSCSGAKRLLPPGCPALFRHEQLHGQPHKPAYDFGHAVHGLLLGHGSRLVEVDADDWRGKAAREQRDAAHAAGHVPLLRADLAAARAATDSVRSHPLGRVLFEQGVAEQSLFWQDERHDVWRRARPDWRTLLPSGRPVVVDLKTCQSAEPGAIAKAVHSFGYHQQQPYYLDGLSALGLADAETAWLFVFVEKTAPYLVTVCELTPDAVEIGRARNDRALATYAECLATDTWPGHVPDTDVPVIDLPAWAYKQEQYA